MKRGQRICAQPGCPNFAPCELHSRPANAPWSRDRDPKAHARFAKAVIERDRQCVRCGSTDQLAAHHIRPGYDVTAGIALCQSCHRELDSHAR